MLGAETIDEVVVATPGNEVFVAVSVVVILIDEVVVAALPTTVIAVDEVVVALPTTIVAVGEVVGTVPAVIVAVDEVVDAMVKVEQACVTPMTIPLLFHHVRILLAANYCPLI